MQQSDLAKIMAENPELDADIQVATIFAIIQTRAAGSVERAHTMRHVGSYSVAAHSWGVAMLMYYLWPNDFPRLAIHCLAHDIPEGWTGDVPAPSKPYVANHEGWNNVEIKIARALGVPSEYDLTFTSGDIAKLKACDLLEFYLWAREQAELGNKFIQEHIHNVQRYITSNPLPEPASKLYERLRQCQVLPNLCNFLGEVMNERE